MTLPQSVKNQIEQAEALQKKNYSNPDADEPSTGEASEQPAESADQITSQPAQQPEPAQAPSQQETRDAAYWRHRFDVVQGKYQAELKPLREENGQLKTQVGQLEAQIKELSEKQVQPKTDTLADAKQSVIDSLTQEKREEFGDDLITLMAEIAMGAVSKTAAPAQPAKDDEVRNEVERLKQEREAEKQEQQEHLTANFMADLNAQVPDWLDLQNADESQQWLKSYDSSTGQRVNDALQQAADRGDVRTAVAMFNHMRKITKKGPKPPENQIQPKNSRATNDAPAEGRTWSGQDIKQFYRDKTDGRYSEEEGQRIEKEIFAAQREGRVI